MAARRSALGRGLGALLPSPGQLGGTGAPTSPAPGGAGLEEIPVASIDPNPEQPRRRFDEAELARLAESIAEHGVLQPVVVRRRGDRYELVVGERRWRAAQLAGRERIPALVRELAPQRRLEAALIENVQRRDLNPIELALAFRALADGGMSQEEIGRRVGLDRSSVANHLRLLDLPAEIQEDVEQGRLGLGHAKALLQVEGKAARLELRARILREQLSVRQAEAAARRAARHAPRRRRMEGEVDPDLAALVESLQAHLQTRVRLAGGPTRGRLEIHFYGPTDLQRIAERILGA